jgi:tetratricopeptide (TPR) repeat protein
MLSFLTRLRKTRTPHTTGQIILADSETELKGQIISLAETPRPAEAFSDFVRNADRFRDTGAPERAMTLYQEALLLEPSHTAIRVQLGNMAKDSGHFEDALSAYEQAAEEYAIAANSATSVGAATKANENLTDVFCQIGHLYKQRSNFFAKLH